MCHARVRQCWTGHIRHMPSPSCRSNCPQDLPDFLDLHLLGPSVVSGLVQCPPRGSVFFPCASSVAAVGWPTESLVKGIPRTKCLSCGGRRGGLCFETMPGEVGASVTKSSSPISHLPCLLPLRQLVRKEFNEVGCYMTHAKYLSPVHTPLLKN